MADMILNFKYNKGVRTVYPAHPMVSNWQFSDTEEEEAYLAHYMAVVAEKNGMTINDVMHVFPPILRILKSDIPWSK